MYTSRVTVDTQGRGSNVPVRLFAMLFIICRCARAGAGMFFPPNQCISVFRLARAEAIPLQHLCHWKANDL
jgi:hypothetical protein